MMPEMHLNSKFRKPMVLVLIAFSTSLILLYHGSFLFRQHPVPQFKVGGSLNSVSKVSRAYSIKPIAYIFPQYYAFEENNRLWGENFTEWDNVKKVTKNAFGLETIRPHESIGFYNGLDFQTRKRQGDFLRENAFYGAVFHHYVSKVFEHFCHIHSVPRAALQFYCNGIALPRAASHFLIPFSTLSFLPFEYGLTPEPCSGSPGNL